jgi:hypothetical protein
MNGRLKSHLILPLYHSLSAGIMIKIKIVHTSDLV